MPKPLTRLYLVSCDHSVVGVWRSLRAAKSAVHFMRRGSLLDADYRIVGPFVLKRGGQ